MLESKMGVFIHLYCFQCKNSFPLVVTDTTIEKCIEKAKIKGWDIKMNGGGSIYALCPNHNFKKLGGKR